MKFSHSLHLNAAPEWHDRYIAYSNLKKLIYRMERAHVVGIPVSAASAATAAAANVAVATPRSASSSPIDVASGPANDVPAPPSVLDLQQYLRRATEDENGGSTSVSTIALTSTNARQLTSKGKASCSKLADVASDDDDDDDNEDNNGDNKNNVNVNNDVDLTQGNPQASISLNRRARTESENSSQYLHSRDATTSVLIEDNNDHATGKPRTRFPRQLSGLQYGDSHEIHGAISTPLFSNNSSSYFLQNDPFDPSVTRSGSQGGISSLFGGPQAVHPTSDDANHVVNIANDDNLPHAKVDIFTCVTVFSASLDKELYRTTQFYIQQEAKLLARYDQLIRQIRSSEFEYVVRHGFDPVLLHPYPTMLIMEPDPENRSNLSQPTTISSGRQPGIFSQSFGATSISPQLGSGFDTRSSVGSSITNTAQRFGDSRGDSRGGGTDDTGSEDGNIRQENSSSTRAQQQSPSGRISSGLDISRQSIPAPHNGPGQLSGSRGSRDIRSRKGQRQFAESFFPANIWNSKEMKKQKAEISKRLAQLFVHLIELKDFAEMNYTGFSKILKKFDKVMGTDIKEDYLELRVDVAEPYLEQTRARLESAQNRVVDVYARINYEGKASMASAALRHNLREHIVWERNTIWRDMVDKERRIESIDIKSRVIDQAPFFKRPSIAVIRISSQQPPLFALLKYRIFKGSRTIWLPYFSTTLMLWVISLTVFFGIILYDFGTVFQGPEQQRCLAILVFASILWATELLPLFITSAIIPGLVVLLRVLRETRTIPGSFETEMHRLTAKEAAKKIFSEMFGPVIMLLLGGFSLASVLSKHNIARQIAGVILEKVGSKPRNAILANMFVSTFLSMWISNVATPVLCFSLVQPILRVLPSGSNYAKCLILGIALSANVGGMASPIASPQNIIAIGNMNPAPSWIEWFAVAIPTATLIDILIWLLLLAIFNPSDSIKEYARIPGSVSDEAAYSLDNYNASYAAQHSSGHDGDQHLSSPTNTSPTGITQQATSPNRATGTLDDSTPLLGRADSSKVLGGSTFPAVEPPELFSRHRGKKANLISLNMTQVFILIVSMITIVLWCIESKYDYIFGDMGIIAILPIAVFYGVGLLTKDDWNSMLWSVVMLAMGGIALGKAVESSGLLQQITAFIIPLVRNLSVFYCLLVFSLITLVVTTFISHTVGALILLPIILDIGTKLDDPRPNTLVMAAAFMCSGGMGLPVSSFPNMNAISQEDHRGKPWLKVTDFLIAGIPASFVTWAVVSTVGFTLMSWLGMK